MLARFQPDIAHLYRAGWPGAACCDRWPGRACRWWRPTSSDASTPSPDAAAIRRHLFMSRFCLERYVLVHGADLASSRYDHLYNPVEVDDLARCRPDFSQPVVGRPVQGRPGQVVAAGLGDHSPPGPPGPGFPATASCVGGVEAAERFVRETGLSISFEPPLTDAPQLAAFLSSLSLLACP